MDSISKFLFAIIGVDDPVLFFNFLFFYKAESFGKKYFNNINEKNYNNFFSGIDSPFFSIFKQFCFDNDIIEQTAKDTLLTLFLRDF